MKELRVCRPKSRGMEGFKICSSLQVAFLLVINGILCLSFLLGRAEARATTDPLEVSAFRSISKHWNITSSGSWNITEPCSGLAIDPQFRVDDDLKPKRAIKCDCSANNGTTCHIVLLAVYYTNLAGTIPDTLQNLTFLENLNLNSNYLTGPLPAFIGNLASMRYFSVGANALSGNIPAELGNLTNLLSLSIGQNNFSGSLPPELGKLVNLTQLYINSAGLSGPIPSTFANLRNLKILWAGDNQFTGKIPGFIGNYTSLQTLWLQGNSFQGPIPSSFSNLTSLTDLRIGELSNGSSSLSFISGMKNLTILVLRNNMMYGTIPTDIWNYQNLRHLDLSFNNLTGQIPRSLFTLNSLSYLFLGNNFLSGLIPSIKSSTLMNIDLSYNNLSKNLPSWIDETTLQINLVGNSFSSDSLNSSLLPGLHCLQQDFPCSHNLSPYSSLAINCGGPEVKSANGTTFERDNMISGASSYFVVETERWAVSSTGMFVNGDPTFIGTSHEKFINTLDPVLFQTTRLSPASLRYYGLGLKNGNYTVNLQFAETAFPNSQAWQSLGKRVFDIYVQGDLAVKDFVIRSQAGDASFRALSMNFKAIVSQNVLEVHLFWAGKGTCCIPNLNSYGPSISAISVTPDFIPALDNSINTHAHRLKKMVVVGGFVISVIAAIGITSICVFYVLRQRKKNLFSVSTNEEVSGMDTRQRTFSYVELKTATEDFSPSNKLGEGGFGTVYRGILPDQQVVAVKQLSVVSHQGKRQFLTEITAVSAVQHRNLVKLYGYCLEGDKLLLVYEYLENKSLDQALFGKGSLDLNWPTRFKICLGIARGLAYLHEESATRIIHRDVKASNVLLDSEFNPKISDFGTARFYDDKKTHISTTKVAGTFGYIAPEYALRGHLTEKADVFAFGILILEILSGRPNVAEGDGIRTYLLDLAWHFHENNSDLELVDPALSEYDEAEAHRIFGIALLCTQTSPAPRPNMSTVIAMLLGNAVVCPVASRPAYLTELYFSDAS